MATKLTKAKIQSIVNHDNLVVRNLQVTQGYYRLSQGMRRLMSNKNASWCAFATHASKTAGQALRHELMPRIMKSAMIRMAGYDNTYLFFDDALGEPDPKLTEENRSLLAEALKRVSLLISAGNTLVFDELAWPFASFVNTFSREWDYDEVKLYTFFQEHFRPGPLERGGQNYLIEAFTAYYKARFETNAKRKAEHVLRGNLLVGLHEQTRLQPHIEQALSVPFEIFAKGQQAGIGKLDQKQKSGLSRQLVTRAATQMMMAITLPGRRLKLGETIIAPTGIVNYPADLLSVEDPHCLGLVRSFETGEDTLSGSAAENWASLKDRMSFVVDFFRSHQQYKRLFEPPFLDNQAPTIEAGRMPGGPL
jgi:hypothetical protein